MTPIDAGGSGSTGHTTARGKKRRKLTPSEAGYRKRMGIPALQCGDCLFFVNGLCEKVAIKPDAGDVCTEFEPSLQGGKLGSRAPGAGTVVKRKSWDDYDKAYCERKFYNAEQRRKMSKAGTAMKDGSFPIADCEDVENALRSLGRTTKSRSSVTAHIRKRAKILGCKLTPALKQNTIGMELIITKVAEDKQSGEKRWFARASGVERDLFNERMSKELFDDFVRRAESKSEVPEPFSSNAWNGGLPYLGVAHYLDLDGAGIVGPTTQIYIDGDYFKARGTFATTELGKLCYAAVKKDIEDDVQHDQRVRVSIAFIDWGHDHEGHGAFKRESLTDRCDLCGKGIGEKIYKSGHLVHLALTRRPAYPQASIELEERSMNKRRDDAASIVGDEKADELEAKSLERLLIGKAEGVDPNAVVIKADEEMGEEEVEEAPYGGAKTLDEAEAYLVQKATEPILMNSWGVLHGVLTNITGQEYSPAIAEQLKAFQTTLDVQALEALQALTQREGIMPENAELVERQPPFVGEEEFAEEVEEEGMTTGIVEEEEVKEEEVAFRSTSEMAEPHDLDETFLALRNAYDEALETPVDRQARLQMIQPALNDVGNAILANIEVPSAVGAVPKDIIKRAIEEAVAPLRAELEALKAKSLSDSTPPSVVPRPRHIISPPRVVSQTPDSLIVRDFEKAEVVSATPKLRDIVRRSVGLRQ